MITTVLASAWSPLLPSPWSARRALTARPALKTSLRRPRGSPKPQMSQEQGQGTSDAPEILLVGAGCTGALAAAILGRETARRGRQARLTVWEWGRGPAGRMTSFWADVNGEKALADMGAQVLSVRDPARVPPWLTPHLISADGAGLAASEERDEGWHHFFAPDGLPALQRASLEEAQPEQVLFSRRVVEMQPNSNPQGKKWRIGYAGDRGGRKPAGFQEFDLVIFAGTARDATGLDGIRQALAPAQLNAMNAVAYDHRVCLGLILDPSLATCVDELCGGRAELSFQSDADGPISLIARQSAKHRTCSKACAVVLHSTVRFAGQNLQSAKSQNRSPSDTGKQTLMGHFAELLRIPLRSLRSAVLADKVVHWRQCQVRRPLPTQDEKCQAGAQHCLVAGQAANLILAGDYLAQKDLAGSFEGCLQSAEAAAQVACKLLGCSQEDALQTSEGEVATAGASVKAPSQNRWQSASAGVPVPATSARSEAGKGRGLGRRWQRRAVEDGYT